LLIETNVEVNLRSIEEFTRVMVSELLEDKINYPEKFEFKDRCDFSNIRSEIKKFIEIIYQILIYFTIFAIASILIPMILITIYQFLIYFITLLTTIWEILVAIIRQIKM